MFGENRIRIQIQHSKKKKIYNVTGYCVPGSRDSPEFCHRGIAFLVPSEYDCQVAWVILAWLAFTLASNRIKLLSITGHITGDISGPGRG